VTTELELLEERLGAVLAEGLALRTRITEIKLAALPHHVGDVVEAQIEYGGRWVPAIVRWAESWGPVRGNYCVSLRKKDGKWSAAFRYPCNIRKPENTEAG